MILLLLLPEVFEGNCPIADSVYPDLLEKLPTSVALFHESGSDSPDTGELISLMRSLHHITGFRSPKGTEYEIRFRPFFAGHYPVAYHGESTMFLPPFSHRKILGVLD
jgi:hypothetical protein